ncbi:hypothetical protein Dimus_038189 [Dionaea muscipula]
MHIRICISHLIISLKFYQFCNIYNIHSDIYKSHTFTHNLPSILHPCAGEDSADRRWSNGGRTAVAGSSRVETDDDGARPVNPRPRSSISDHRCCPRRGSGGIVRPAAGHGRRHPPIWPHPPASTIITNTTSFVTHLSSRIPKTNKNLIFITKSSTPRKSKLQSRNQWRRVLIRAYRSQSRARSAGVHGNLAGILGGFRPLLLGLLPFPRVTRPLLRSLLLFLPVGRRPGSSSPAVAARPPFRREVE